MALSIEKRPPTQSQNPTTFAGSIPNSRTASAFVETAAKCRATSTSEPSCERSQSNAEWAFVIVSDVVNVFEETMNIVVAASRSRNASVMSVPSTLET